MNSPTRKTEAKLWSHFNESFSGNLAVSFLKNFALNRCWKTNNHAYLPVTGMLIHIWVFL
jgi:hypothetical protein